MAQCADCKYWENSLQQCRKHPPTVIHQIMQVGHVMTDAISTWPEVEGDDWCGDWVEKKEGII